MNFQSATPMYFPLVAFAMNLLSAALLIVFLPAIVSCGGSADASGNPVGNEPVEAENFLAVTVDGTRYEARGTLFGPSVTFGGREINVQVGGPLTSAVATGKSVSLGDYDVLMNVLTNSIEPGAYTIVPNRNRVTRGEESLGFAEIFFPDSVPFGKLRPLSGTLTVDSVDGSEDSGRYRLQRAEGHVTGEFRDSAGTERAVDIEFVYNR